MLRFLLSKTTISVKLMLSVGIRRFRCSGLWCIHLFDSVEGAEAPFSKSQKHDTRTPEVDPCGGRSFNFGDGASSKATSLSRLPVRNDALGDFWILVHVFVEQSKPTPLMLGMDFLKEHRCVVNCGADLIQFPMQSDCWWLLFVSSRGLYSMPLCGQLW